MHLFHQALGQFPLLSLLIFTPLIGAALSLATDSLGLTRYTKPVALLASLLPLLLSALMLSGFVTASPGFQLVERQPWLPNLHVEYFLGIDGISVLFIALTALLTPICILASWNITKRIGLYMACFLALESFVIGVFSALDFILFYVFWEAMLIPMFLLIGIWGGENRVYAAIKFFLYTFVGSVLMLVAGLYLYSHFGHFDITQMSGNHLPLLTQQLLWLAFFAAFAVKVPMWPFHTWLPDAHVQAPTAGSVILAGILLKMGAYGFLRFSLPILPEASAYFAPMVFALSAIAIVYAALVAFVQTDIKRIIAYSSVSHMGLVTLGIFAGTETSLHGALLVMVNHGIVSAGLFLCVGVVYDRLHTRELSKFGGLVVPMPQYAFVMMLLTLAAVALPGTNSFVGEFLGLAGSYPVAPVATAVATTGVIFGALYMLWLYRRMIFGTPSPFIREHMPNTEHRTPAAHHMLADLSPREWATFLPLLLFIPLLGLQPSIAQDYWRASVRVLAHNYSAAQTFRLTRHERLGIFPDVSTGPDTTLLTSSSLITSATTPSTTMVSATSVFGTSLTPSLTTVLPSLNPR